MSLYDGDTALSFGDKYLSKDVDTAKVWYNIALEDKDYRTRALLKLIDLETKLGRYSAAREYVHLIEDFSDLSVCYRLARLDQSEHNYMSALDNYSKSLSGLDLQAGALLYIADIYTQLGEFETARRMYETLLYTYKENASFGIVNIDIIEGDYNHGLKVLQGLNCNGTYRDDYDNLFVTLKYFQGKLSEIKDKYKNQYTFKRFFSDEEDVLLKHLKKHLKPDFLSDNYFTEGVTNELFLEVNEKLKVFNPSYYKGVLKYKFDLGYDIGVSANMKLQGICVFVSMDGKKIITMFPLGLSSEFDREGMLTNEELSRKRVMGVRK